jgi:hypothetical protein
MAREDLERIQNGILGDIKPKAAPHVPSDRTEDEQAAAEADESMAGGSRHDRTEHAGSRDVTEGTTGGTGTEVGGTRNYRTGTGATGMDIGNRPE